MENFKKKEIMYILLNRHCQFEFIAFPQRRDPEQADVFPSFIFHVVYELRSLIDSSWHLSPATVVDSDAVAACKQMLAGYAEQSLHRKCHSPPPPPLFLSNASNSQPRRHETWGKRKQSQKAWIPSESWHWHYKTPTWQRLFSILHRRDEVKRARPRG